MMQDCSLFIDAVPRLVSGALVTLKISFAALLLGFCGGTVIGILNCQRLATPFLKAMFNAYVWVVRGTPLFVQVLVVYYAVPEVFMVSFSPFVAGVMALGINSTAYVAEIVRSGMNAIPDGQWDASYVVGFGPWKTVQKIIFPQALKVILPGLTNECTALVKETSILMTIGVVELTKVSKDIVTRELNPMTIYVAAALLYLVMTSAIAIVARFFEKRWYP